VNLFLGLINQIKLDLCPSIEYNNSILCKKVRNYEYKI